MMILHFIVFMIFRPEAFDKKRTWKLSLVCYIVPARGIASISIITDFTEKKNKYDY